MKKTRTIPLFLSLFAVTLLASCTNTQRNPSITESNVDSNKLSNSSSSPISEKKNQNKQTEVVK